MLKGWGDGGGVLLPRKVHGLFVWSLGILLLLREGPGTAPFLDILECLIGMGLSNGHLISTRQSASSSSILPIAILFATRSSHHPQKILQALEFCP